MTEVLEKETEYLTPQDRAEAIFYGAAAPKFSSNHDLTEYNRIADKYGVQTQGAQTQTFAAERQTMQPYAEPVDAYVPPAPVAAPVSAPEIEKQNQKTNLQPYYSPNDTLTADMLPKRRAPEPVQKIIEEPVMMDMTQQDIKEEKAVEYVWKFKTKTLVAVMCVAVVLALLCTLLVVNAVDIAKANVELNQLENQYDTASAEYEAARAAAALAKEKALQQLESSAGEYTVLPVGYLPANYDRYKEPVDLESSTSMFDAICEFLSKIF
jgi:hypothetical protein